MGHSSRKKKKRGAAGRKAAKDHAAQLEGDQAALDEELTALPYSDGMGFEDLSVSAILDVICFPGYPHKCPKLRIIPEKNLSKADADQLLSLLVDQASIYSREGRVMIFNLFEAAQEFLSEIAPAHISGSTASCLGSSSTTDVDVKVSPDSDRHPGVSYIYTSFDLYSQLYDDTSWSRQAPDLIMDSGRKNTGSQVKSNVRSKRKAIIEKTHVSPDKVNNVKSPSGDKAEQQRATKHVVIQEAASNLHVVAEETENDSKTLSTSNGGNTSCTPERSSGSLPETEDCDLQDKAWNEEDCDSDFSSSNDSSYVSDMLDDASRNKKRDLILVHLLRIACASKDSLSASLPAISSELCNIGVLSEWAKNLISDSPTVFGETFGHVFKQQMISSECSLFWRVDNSSSRPNSRYLNDFEELRSLGQGGFGRVALCQNKLDGRQYAVKKIRLKDRSPQVNEKILRFVLREVATLSRLQHQHVVRYYQAWVETEYGHHNILNAGGSRTAESSIFSYDDISLSDASGGNKEESTYLYIQMEYCPRSSPQVGCHEGRAEESRRERKGPQKEVCPKFLKLEQLDHDQYFPTEAMGVSMDGTGQVGTYFYTAPEVEQKWPQINEKAYLLYVLRMIQTPEDTYVYDRVISTVFNEDRLIAKMQCQHESSKKSTGNTDNSELLDTIIEAAKEVFKQHCAKRFQISPLHTLEDNFTENRYVISRPLQCPMEKTVKILTQGGDMLELCYELRTPFVMSIVGNQTSSFKRYEISWVHRRAVGHSTPFRFLQGDFDIIGGASPIPEAEIIKVTLDLGARFYDYKDLVIRLNHGKLAEAICSWAGVSQERRRNVAEFLSSTLVQYWPNKADRKSQWSLIRGQLLQDLRLSEEVVEKLHKADQRFCGSADQVLARLKGTLFYDKSACKALDDLSALLKCLRVWLVEEPITIDVLMPPSECYYTDLFFQVYSKEGNHGPNFHEKLLAVGGRYDWLMEQAWDKAHKSKPPGAVGVSIALEKFLPNYPSSDLGLPRLLSRIEPSISVLVCSRGGGGLLNERMELVAELWKANIKAQFVPQEDPSLQEQYEYASDHDIKCLVFITESGLSQTDLVKVNTLNSGCFFFLYFQ
nr:unnamed protein product [Digitaria exilis]